LHNWHANGRISGCTNTRKWPNLWLLTSHENGRISCCTLPMKMAKSMVAHFTWNGRISFPQFTWKLPNIWLNHGVRRRVGLGGPGPAHPIFGGTV
jgi:hypothetical protein